MAGLELCSNASMSCSDRLPDRALSVRQPWAWAIIHAGKDIENRSWQSLKHMGDPLGRVALHASQGITQREYDEAAHFMGRAGVTCPPAKTLARGAIIGAVTIAEIVNDHASPWFMGPRGLLLRNPEICEPIPVAGALGLFEWGSRRIVTMPAPAAWMLKRQAQTQDPQGTLF